MLLVKHYIGPSKLHGLGVFSAIFIPKGTKIWEYHPIIDREFQADDLQALPGHVVGLIHRHAEFFPDRGVFRLSSDGDFFMNHSDDPNFCDKGDAGYAARDIYPDDEVACDYRDVRVFAFHPDGNNSKESIGIEREV